MCVCMCDTRCAPESYSKEEYIVGNVLATSIKKKDPLSTSETTMTVSKQVHFKKTALREVVCM